MPAKVLVEPLSVVKAMLAKSRSFCGFQVNGEPSGPRADLFGAAHPQVTQKPFQALLILGWLRPLPEVANVALVAELARPSLGCRHHSIVKSDRKEDGHVPLPLLSKCFGDFILNPIARDGSLRQDDEQLVSKADCLIDRVPGLGTDGQIMRRKPASHAFVLQVGVKPLGKRLVLRRVTDKTGVE